MLFQLKKRNAILFVFALLLCIIGFIFISIFLHQSLYLNINNSFDYNPSRLILLRNFSEENKEIPDFNNYVALYKFTKKQKNAIEEILKNENVSLSLKIKLTDNSKISEKSILTLCFAEKERFQDIIADNNILKCNLLRAPDSFNISLAFNKKTNVPECFYVYSSVPFSIEKADIIPTFIGFDRSKSIPYYGVSHSGGVIDFSNNSFDFSTSFYNFPEKNLPEYVVKLSEKNKSTFEIPVYSYINFGNEEFSIKNVVPATEVIIPSSGLKEPFSKMTISLNPENITAVFIKSSSTEKVDKKGPFKPVKTDPGLILNYNQNLWRNESFEVFQWDRNNKTIIFDTKDYETQAKFFSRMAYFIEKKGFKGKLLTNEELSNKHGYNAHDYSTESMANFYNTALDNNFSLNSEELIVKKILIDNSFFSMDENKHVISNGGGLASISRESSPWLRKLFLSHEGMHTIFFSDSDFRNYVTTVYHTIDSRASNFIIDYFNSQPQLGYDTNDDYLMKNEFMAYIMQQELSAVPDYFIRLANILSVKDYTPELSNYIIETNARGIEDAAIALNDYVFDKYGIAGGNLCLVLKEKRRKK